MRTTEEKQETRRLAHIRRMSQPGAREVRRASQRERYQRLRKLAGGSLPEAKARNRAWTRSNKGKVLAHYGGKCECCGETSSAFLTVDHVDGNGAAHRREAGGPRGAGANMYLWLIKNDYPGGFRLLCWNCNAGRHYNGGICPHQVLS